MYNKELIERICKAECHYKELEFFCSCLEEHEYDIENSFDKYYSIENIFNAIKLYQKGKISDTYLAHWACAYLWILHAESFVDSYYDTLSGFHKSLRGSDPDAALHYLAKLLESDDLQSISRRLICVAYEDIGLANPTLASRVKIACDAARELGLPEARLPLAAITIELALSPKSNSAYLALEKATEDIKNGKSGSLPLHLKNTYSFNPSQKNYKYPHDYPNSYVVQQYLPDILVGSKYYVPKANSKFEQGLKERYDFIESLKNKK